LRRYIVEMAFLVTSMDANPRPFTAVARDAVGKRKKRTEEDRVAQQEAGIPLVHYSAQRYTIFVGYAGWRQSVSDINGSG
jgi:hypothetical protein